MSNLVIGVLALQGGFSEHLAMLSKLHLSSGTTVHGVLVKTPEDLSGCDAIIIPGGESTTIALLARLAGLLGPLRKFAEEKPIWGTCAGAILLAKEVIGGKKGGQEILGGMDVKLGRNGWGSQMESFEAELRVAGMQDEERPYLGVFIRAPVLLAFLNPHARRYPIEVVARLPDQISPSDDAAPFTPAVKVIADQEGVVSHEQGHSEHDLRTVVALRQGQHLMTTFHPELTRDERFHEYFVRTCVEERKGDH